MLERLHVENFQSLRDVDIELGEFTVIVGPSGRGKSSLIRALRAVCFNKTGETFIRHGQAKATVTLTFDGGQEIEWAKPRKKGAVYGFGDTEYTRTGRGVPDEISSALAIRQVEIEKGFKFAPQFHGQHDAPLLLTESSTVAARALAKLTKLSVLVAAQMDCRRDRGRAQQHLAAAEEDEERLRGELRELPSVKKSRNLMDQADRQVARLKTEVARVVQGVSISEDIYEALRLADVTLPSGAVFEDIEDAFTDLDTLTKRITSQEERDAFLEDAEGDVVVAEGHADDMQNKYDALVEELGVCPLCGSGEKWGHDDH